MIVVQSGIILAQDEKSRTNPILSEDSNFLVFYFGTEAAAILIVGAVWVFESD